jgi:hypothetical protein
MLTLFASPKPFRGDIEVIQRNALRSWILLRPTPEIILFGKDEGIAEVAREFGLRNVPEIACNEYGTPLVSDLFQKCQELAKSERLCYVNSDIILLNDFIPAVNAIPFPKFLMVGRRWNLAINGPFDFSNGWEGRLRTVIQQTGELHPPTGIDYFVFSRGIYREIPRFAIGRTSWDNWLIYRARALKIPIIDATQSVTVVHQNHGYEHHPGGSDGVWKGREAEINLELAGSPRHLFTLRDATHWLTPDGLLRKPDFTKENLLRRIEARMVLQPGFQAAGRILTIFLTPVATLRRAFDKLRSVIWGGVY